MDKYEFNIKVEQMKKLVNRNDFETAAKIADSIDWRRVRSANLLTTVATIYEENGDYQEAIDVMLIAFERAPGGKYLLYKLTALALKNNNISEAEAYYHEFCDIARDDSRKHLLRFLILKEKGASAEQLIQPLEHYVKEELDEKWLYELAELYHQDGRQEQCVELCDKIMLMFGLGKYVDQAMALKQEYEPLTQYQVDLMENKEKYEEKLRAVELEFGSMPIIQEPLQEVSEMSIDEEVTAILQHDPDTQVEIEPEIEPDVEPLVLESEPVPDTIALLPEEEAATETTQEYETTPSDELVEDEPETAETQEPMIESTNDTDIEEEGQVQDMQQIKAVTPMAAEALKHNSKDDLYQLDLRSRKFEHFIIEVDDEEQGLSLAVAALKTIHRKNSVKRPVIKISGEKLNKKGVLNSAQQLNGKDLIVDFAGDMTAVTVSELKQWIQTSDLDKTVILIDNPRQIQRLTSDYPALKMIFKSDIPTECDEDMTLNQPKDHLGVYIKEEFKKKIKDDRELDWEEFERYACKYASEIDCYIPEKSIFALQERIELMEDDDIPLTKENAEELIEKAADRAEKPTIGRFVTGVFAPKYNKDGLLVLREQHFFD